jgi:hypothetical protein
VHLLALPGYFEKRFSRSGACAYKDADLKNLQDLGTALRKKGDAVILTSHGPPKNDNALGIDVASEGKANVGDPRVTALLDRADIRFGIFSHILEAGGRAVADAPGSTAVIDLKKRKTYKTPARDSLFINVGSASALPWTMLDNSASEGLAAIFELDGDQASALFIRLR